MSIVVGSWHIIKWWILKCGSRIITQDGGSRRGRVWEAEEAGRLKYKTRLSSAANRSVFPSSVSSPAVGEGNWTRESPASPTALVLSDYIFAWPASTGVPRETHSAATTRRATSKQKYQWAANDTLQTQSSCSCHFPFASGLSSPEMLFPNWEDYSEIPPGIWWKEQVIWSLAEKSSNPVFPKYWLCAGGASTLISCVTWGSC